MDLAKAGPFSPPKKRKDLIIWDIIKKKYQK
jgi:hypothetical protein